MLLEDFQPDQDSARSLAFQGLADAQRGAPEHAMLRVQFANRGGILNPVVEHVGDLTHRMAQYPDSHIMQRDRGYELVKDKVEKTLRWMTAPYGFEREMEGNIRNNVHCGVEDGKITPEEEPSAQLRFRAKLDAALAKYADEHAKLTVYNIVQWHARQAAVMLGRKQWAKAVGHLQALQGYLADEQTWAASASQFDPHYERNSLIEGHHHYPEPSYDTPFAPLHPNDSITLYHGFRSHSDAVQAARTGLSGAEKADRVYSYEYDNNPKGLFVTLSPQVAKNFGRTVMQFVTKVSELDLPVWPSGQYTVQGGMAEYFGRGPEGRRKRRDAQRREREKQFDWAGPAVADSHDPAMALRLFCSGEYQALYVGHLNPADIICFLVDEGGGWTKRSVEEIAQDHLDSKKEKIFSPNEPFDAEKMLAGIRQYAGREDIEDSMEWMKSLIKKAPVGRRVAAFDELLGRWLWPKQKPAAALWLKNYK